jgi:hypothetical protein
VHSLKKKNLIGDVLMVLLFPAAELFSRFDGLSARAENVPKISARPKQGYATPELIVANRSNIEEKKTSLGKTKFILFFIKHVL